MGTGDDLGFKSELVRARSISDAEARAVGKTSDSERRIALPDIAGDWIEPKRAARVKVGNETDAMRGARRGVACGGEGGLGLVKQRGRLWICRLLVG